MERTAHMARVEDPPIILGRDECTRLLLDGLTDSQQEAVRSDKRRVLIVAGAGSGKTEVMARRIAWWISVEGVPKDSIVAFTFTERAAEEMKFRIRERVQSVTAPGEDATLGGMYIGTIHGFCISQLRTLAPDEYHNYDVIDEAARHALVQRGYDPILGLHRFQAALEKGRFATIAKFLEAYDLLNEYGQLDVELAAGQIPARTPDEGEWCKRARLRTVVGDGASAETFAQAAGRYYAYLRCRRCLDFSTSQSELMRLFRRSETVLRALRDRLTHVVVDEVQDINVIQDMIIRTVLGDTGTLTAVGDHRQAVYAWWGGRVDIMAQLFEELERDPEGEVVSLAANFRSTLRIIDVANRWARTIGGVRSMSSPDMGHGNAGRLDADPTHVAAVRFDSREDEAEWIAERIRQLVPNEQMGASLDAAKGERGLSYSDVAILLRSSTSARQYMEALERRGIPAVFRAGPDLLSQPEVMLFVAAFAVMAGVEEFYGSDYNPKSFPSRIQDVLGCAAKPEDVVRAACRTLRDGGLPLAADAEKHLLLVCKLVRSRLEGEQAPPEAILKRIRTPQLADWLRRRQAPRGASPQALYHYLLGEAGVADWESVPGRGQVAMFHLGQLSSLVTGIEMPGWMPARDFKYQIIALYLWAADNARADEAPLLVEPHAVTISTVHGIKGLEFGAVFLADVNAQRFPSSFAKRQSVLPFAAWFHDRINPADLADNDNLDNERRLMYVAVTRAERYLFMSASRPSQFFKQVEAEISAAGGTVGTSADAVPSGIRLTASQFRHEARLATSFSDLRYYLECPHDFYLRKVLGFAPTIDQAFGYGRGVHNLMRAIHSRPAAWADLAGDPRALDASLQELMDRGLFYMRYTTGEPLDRMQAKAKQILADYIRTYAHELAGLGFLPEREFETLIEEEQVLVSGAMDVLRLDDPPRVTLIDFKSGEPDSDISITLDQDEMRLQVSLYGMAAKKELEYEPERGLVRYLGEEDPQARELAVDLSEASLSQARQVVINTARSIRERRFHLGPTRKARSPEHEVRCPECDFFGFCGMDIAKQQRIESYAPRQAPVPPVLLDYDSPAY